jgi:hypothetical protein
LAALAGARPVRTARIALAVSNHPLVVMDPRQDEIQAVPPSSSSKLPKFDDARWSAHWLRRPTPEARTNGARRAGGRPPQWMPT